MTLFTTTIRPKTCKICRCKFQPRLSLAIVCGVPCAKVMAAKIREKAAKVAAAKAKVAAIKQRIADQAKRETQKTPSKLEGECRAIVQKIARIRDRNDGCISCHMPADYAGMWHGSHYRPAGNNAAVQFHLWNINKSCAQCNLFKGGNLGAYRPRLVEKIGADRVEWLERQNHAVKTSVPYLIRFKAVMGQRLRRIKKRLKAAA